MQISKEHLEKFKEIYFERFGNMLSDGEALEKGMKLLRLMELIYKPMTREQMDMVTARSQSQPDHSQL